VTAGAQGAAGRVARNTGVRATAELIGKFSSLALMAVLARQEGAEGLGILVFAFAWSEITTTPIQMGFDRYLLRRVAADRADLERYLANTFRLKLGRTVPVIAVSWTLVLLLGYDGDTRAAVFLMTFAFLLDSFSYSLFSVFNGVERGDLIGIMIVVQRLVSGGTGVAVLLAGFGVVTVAAVYVAAAALAFGIGVWLVARRVGLPRIVFPREPRRDLRRKSIPFAAQEVLSSGLARIDAVLLSLLATQAVVGLYGAAYRLLEATLFIPIALQGAFAAMFTYLDDRSDPTISAAFSRSIKLALTLLLPCAVPLAVLPGPLLTLFFGGGFEESVTAMRILAPVVVLLGLVLLSVSLISSRLNPRMLVTYFAITLVVNVAVNVALIPSLGQTGAAIGMLAAEIVLCVLALGTSVRAVGGVRLSPTAGGPALAAGAMAAVLLLLEGLSLLALPVGGAVYVAVLAAAERRLAPADLDFAVAMVRSRLPLRFGGTRPNEPLEER
jgi:O-antigen/teichoic acid export membrane protein